MTTLFLSIILMAIAIILLGVRVFFMKNGEFPNTHVGANKALRNKGIRCATSQDREAQTILSNPIEAALKSDL